MPRITRPQVHRIVYELLPRRRWTSAELLWWLEDPQRRKERAKRSHAKRRARQRALSRPVQEPGRSWCPVPAELLPRAA
jgi:hypothetical protein